MIQSRSLWELIESRAAQTPDELFAVDEENRSLGFEAYRQRCQRTAAALFARGVTAHSRVSWVLPTGLEALILMGALARLSARQNPILPIYRQREIGFMVEQSNCQLLIVPREFRGYGYAEMAAGLADRQPGLDVCVVDPLLPEIDAPLPVAAGAPHPDGSAAGAASWLFYTSGTTADPKGALHTDSSLMAYSAGMAHCLNLRADDRIALVFPVTHIGGAGWLMAGLMSGAAQICVAIFDPKATPALLARHSVTQAAAGTVFHRAYLDAQRANRNRGPLFPAVRSFPGGGAPKPPQLHFDIKREMGGAGIVSGYGLTECPTASMGRVSDPDSKLAHTEGRANPSELQIRIVTLSGSSAEAGQEGEVRLRGPQLFQGYLDANLNRDAFDDQGYFRTGDLGHLDAQGYLSITGRLKDVIIRKGENISAKEVEDLLHEHPKVSEVAVIGLPDTRSGERCCAVVVSNTDGSPLDFEEMTRFLRERALAPQKIPEQLEFVDSLPRNPTGKILKPDLRKRFAAT